MNNDLLQDVLHFCLIAGAVLVVLLIILQVRIARLKQKNYFLNRDRERYAETLYASKDGYFAFIYPDERIRDPRRTVRERCSRRLAVMLGLKEGIQADFDAVMSVFYKEDAQKIRKYVHLMKEEGIGFEDIFSLKTTGQSISVAGSRIHGHDGNLYCDMLWFRDLSDDLKKNRELQAEKEELESRTLLLENILDTLNCPIWVRDESLKITAANRRYMELAGVENPDELSSKKIPDSPIISDKTAKSAVSANKIKKSPLKLVRGGKAFAFEVIEAPFRMDNTLEKNGTVGMLLDMSELEEVKRDFKIHQTAHLEVLSALGTAFAIYNTEQKLIFYNKAFVNLWNLNVSFLENNPSFGEFLDEIRSMRLLPEVSDYRLYKSDAEKMFTSLISPKETLLHIPDGRTFKQMVAPYPNGLIFAYEDVSDRLAATRMINELVSVQQNILDQVKDAVVIFGADQNLRWCNQSYCKLWNISELQARSMLNLNEVLELQRPYLTTAAPWDDVKQTMMRHILNLHADFIIERCDNIVLEVSSAVLSDDSVMITYKAV